MSNIGKTEGKLANHHGRLQQQAKSNAAKRKREACTMVEGDGAESIVAGGRV